MSIQTTEGNIRILFLLYLKKKLSIKLIQKEIHLHYNTISDKLEKWSKSGIVDKIKKSTLLLGGDRYEYQLNNEGINFVNKIAQYISDSIDLIKHEEFELQVKEFIDKLPEILKEIEITFNNDQKRQLKERIEAFFKNFK